MKKTGWSNDVYIKYMIWKLLLGLTFLVLEVPFYLTYGYGTVNN